MKRLGIQQRKKSEVRRRTSSLAADWSLNEPEMEAGGPDVDDMAGCSHRAVLQPKIHTHTHMDVADSLTTAGLVPLESCLHSNQPRAPQEITLRELRVLMKMKFKARRARVRLAAKGTPTNLEPIGPDDIEQLMDESAALRTPPPLGAISSVCLPFLLVGPCRS
jgi:hypothetical protein